MYLLTSSSHGQNVKANKQRDKMYQITIREAINQEIEEKRYARTTSIKTQMIGLRKLLSENCLLFI